TALERTCSAGSPTARAATSWISTRRCRGPRCAMRLRGSRFVSSKAGSLRSRSMRREAARDLPNARREILVSMRDERVVAINVGDLARRAQRWVGNAVGTVMVEAGFVSFPLVTVDAERDAAWPLITRLQDKRVFSADDCCHDCVKNSITSLLEVRTAII